MGTAVILAFLISPIIYAQAQTRSDVPFPEWLPLYPRRPPILMWPSVMNTTFYNFDKEYEGFGLESMGTKRKCYDYSMRPCYDNPKRQCHDYSVFRMQETEVLSWIEQYIKVPDKGRQERTLFPKPDQVCGTGDYIRVTRKGSVMWREVLPALTRWLSYRVLTCGMEMFFPVQKEVAYQLIGKNKHQWYQIILCVLSLIFRTFVVIQYKNREDGFLEKPFAKDSNNVEKWVTLLENWAEKYQLQILNDEFPYMEIMQLIDTSFDIVTAIIMDYLTIEASKYPQGTERATMMFGNVDIWYKFGRKKTLVQDMADNFFKCEVVNTCKCTKRPSIRKVKAPEYFKKTESVPNGLLLFSGPIYCTFNCTAIPEETLYPFAPMATEATLHMFCPPGNESEIIKHKNSFMAKIDCYPLELMKAAMHYYYNTCGAGNSSCVMNHCECLPIYTEKRMKLQDFPVEEILLM